MAFSWPSGISRTPQSSAARLKRTRMATFSRKAARRPMSPACFTQATCRIAVTNRPLQPLEWGGGAMADLMKCSVFLSDSKDFGTMNESYAQFFGDAKPARTTVESKFADPKMRVEIDCIAYKPKR